jgi:hypothetical protein
MACSRLPWSEKPLQEQSWSTLSGDVQTGFATNFIQAFVTTVAQELFAIQWPGRIVALVNRPSVIPLTLGVLVIHNDDKWPEAPVDGK